MCDSCGRPSAPEHHVGEYLCLPHEPELENINMATALNGLVPRVVRHVVLLVRLEEVAGAHGVAAL